MTTPVSADASAADGSAAGTDGGAATKAGMRAVILRARQVRTPTQRNSDAGALGKAAGALVDAEVARTPAQPIVAVYLSMGTEPSTSGVLAALRQRAVSVIAPILRDDGDLDWAVVTDDERRPGLRATVQPPGVPLGVGAVAEAAIVLVPALAVDREGHRLGRGGGSYDRALLRVPADRLVLAVVHDDEIVGSVPFEPHDARVGGALTPSGVVVFGATADA